MEEPTPPPPPEPAAPAPSSPVRTALDLAVPALRAVLYIVVYVFLQLAVVLTLSAFARLGGGSHFRRGGFWTSNEAFLVVTVLTLPPLILATWVFARFLDRRTLASLGARTPEGGAGAALRQLVAAPLGALAVLGAWLLLVLALPASLAAVHYGGISPNLAHGPAWWPFSPPLLLAVLLLGFLLQGGLEEWIIRGYVYHTLRERWRPWIAALASSLLFSSLHLGNPAVSVSALVNIVLAGMVLAALVERTGSLWSATLAHGVWNFALACLLSVPVSGVPLFHLLNVTLSGDPGLTGGAFGPEGSWLLTVIGLALTAFLWRGLWRRPSERAVAVRPSTPEDAVLPSSPDSSL